MVMALGVFAFAGFCMAQDMTGKILVHGHRGAAAMRPENTLPAFEYAIGAGVNVLELDLAVTKDNVLVVSHDPVLHAPTCSGPQATAVIRNLTLEQVRQWDCGSTRNPRFPQQQTLPGTRMPTLDEVFALAPKGKFLFNVETKTVARRITQAEGESYLQAAGVALDSQEAKQAMEAITLMGPEMTPPPEEFVKLFLAQIRKHRLEDRVILQSFDYRTLHAMKKMAPEIKLSALTQDRTRSFADILKETGAHMISPSFQLVTPENVQAVHALGAQVVPYTPNKPEDWKRLIDAKVDAIITDDPAGLIAYLQHQK